MLSHVWFSIFSVLHVMPGLDVWSLLPHSVHGEFLHHCCCGPSEAQEQESEIKESVIHNNEIEYYLTWSSDKESSYRY